MRFERAPGYSISRRAPTEQKPSIESSKVLDCSVDLEKMLMQVVKMFGVLTLSRPTVVDKTFSDCDTVGWRII